MFITANQKEGRKELVLSGRYHDKIENRAQVTDALRVGGMFSPHDEIHLVEGDSPFYANGEGAFLARILGAIAKARDIRIVCHVPSLKEHERFFRI